MAVCSKCGNYYSTTTCIYCEDKQVSTNADTMRAENIALVTIIPEPIEDDYAAPPIEQAVLIEQVVPLDEPFEDDYADEQITPIAATIAQPQAKKNTSQPAFQTIATKTASDKKPSFLAVIIFSILGLVVLLSSVILLSSWSGVKVWILFIAISATGIVYFFKSKYHSDTPDILVETDGKSLRFYSASAYHTYPLNEIMYVEFHPDRYKHDDLLTGSLTIAVESDLYDIMSVENVAAAHAFLLEMLQLTYNYDT